MKDTTADVEMLIKKFYKKNYPVSGNLLEIISLIWKTVLQPKTNHTTCMEV